MKLRILNVDESAVDAQMINRVLADAGYEIESAHADNASSMNKALSTQSWNLILFHFESAEFDSFNALKMLRENELGIPLIVISKSVGEELVVKNIKAGAHDFLPEDNLERLAVTVGDALRLAEESVEFKHDTSKLIESDKHLRALVKSVDGILWEAKVEPFGYTFVVGYAEKLLGYPISQWTEEPHFFANHIHPEDRDATLKYCVECTIEKRDHVIEYRFIGADGRIVWLRDIVNVIIENDKAVRLRGLTIDITDRKNVEITTRADEARFRAVSETASDSIVIINESSEIVYHNSATEKIFGYSAKDLEGQILTMLMPVELGKRHIEGIKRYLNSGKKTLAWDNIELTGLHKLGHEIPLEISFSEFSSDGERNFTGIIRDVSQRKKTDHELVEIKERFHHLADNIDDVFWIRSPDLETIYYLSPGFERVWGRNIEAYIADGGNWIDLLFHEDRDWVPAAFAKLESGAESVDLEYRIVRPDGEIRWIHTRGFQVKDSDGKLIRLAGIVSDITRRKRDEKKLQFTQAKIASIVDSAMDGIISVDEFQTIVLFNPAAVKIFGWNSAEAVGQPLEKFIPGQLGEILRKLESEFNQIGSSQSRSGERATLVGIRSNGDEFQVQAAVSTALVGDQMLATVFLRDITEQLKAEEKLVKSEEQYRDLVENAYDMIYTRDMDGYFTSINSAGEKLTGYSNEELLSMKFTDLVVPEQMESIEKLFGSLPERGEGVTFEADILAKDGRKISLEINKRIILRDGVMIGVQSIARDITDRKLFETRLSKSEEQYRELVENAYDIIYSHDLAGNYTSLNAAATHITGYSLAEAQQISMADTVVPEQLDFAKEMIKRKLVGEIVAPYELDIVAKDGLRLTVEVNTRLIYSDGVPIGVQGIARDISDRKRLEEQLMQSQKLESVGRLAGGVAHDFNNMLTVINCYSDIALRRLAENDPVRQNIAEIRKAGERAALITNQLLAFSRKQLLHPQLVMINDVITETSGMLERLIGENVELVTDLEPGVGVALADPGQLSQIIVNLAVNSRDAMPDGGKLTIRTENASLSQDDADNLVGIDRGEFILISVVDSGTGIAPESLDQVFEPFFTTKEVGKGTGLGLAMVYGIVKQSGGSIFVESEFGRGTTFKIYLPRVEDSLA